MMDHNRLPLPVYSARQFGWLGRSGAVEASELPALRPSRIFKDACDVGFQVRSPRTGRILTFAHTVTERDRDGDVIAEVFEDTQCLGITIRVFNE